MKILTEEEIFESIKQEKLKIKEIERQINNLRAKKRRSYDKLTKLLWLTPNQIEMDFNEDIFI